MAQITITNINDLGLSTRIDAQFYQPKYLINTKVGNWQKLRQLVKKCEYGLSLAMNDEKKGLPMLKMDDIKDTFVTSNDARYSEVSDKESKKFKCQLNDIFFNRVNSEEFVGRTGIFKENDVNSVFASYLIRIQTRQEIILPQYLNIFINSKFGQKQIDRYKRRAVNQANINAQELQEFLIFLPNIEKQKKIARLVDEAWDLKQKSSVLYQQAEQLLLKEIGLENLETEWVAGYETNLNNVINMARIDAEYFQPKFEEVKETIRKNKFDLLSNLVKPLKKGIEVGSNAYQGNGIPFMRISNLNTKEIDFSNAQYISEDLYSSLKDKYCPKKGEILLSKDGTPGLAYFLREEIKAIIAGGIVRLSTKNIEPEYLTLVLNSLAVQSQIRQEAGGALIKHWRPDQIKRTIIPILESDLRSQISDLVNRSFKALNESQQLLAQAKKEVEDMIENPNN